MKRIYIAQVGIIIWFFLLYNIERLIAPINLASFIYVYATGIVILILAFPALHKWPSIRLFILALIPYFLLKTVLGYEIAGQNLPITITEITSLYITLIISRLLGHDLNQVRDEIIRLTIGISNNGVNNFSEGQAEIYREVRRARRYNRPAALLIVGASSESVELATDRIIEEVREGIAQNYANARVAKLLQGQLKFSDVITKQNNSFIILLPETSHDQVPSVIHRLKTSASDSLGLALEIGYSTFPGEAVTFSGLLEHAESKMNIVKTHGKVRGSKSQGAAESST